MSDQTYEILRLDTDHGPVAARRYLPARRPTAGVVMVGGVGGGFDTPARDLYPRLAEEMAADGVAALRVRFRDPRRLDDAVADVLAGTHELRGHGVEHIALIGHSFGGAVVIAAAAQAPDVVAVVTLSTQSYGTEAVAELRCPILLVHGTADAVLPHQASEHVARRAGGPTDVVLLDGIGHDLIEFEGLVHATVRDWLVERLVDRRHDPLRGATTSGNVGPSGRSS